VRSGVRIALLPALLVCSAARAESRVEIRLIPTYLTGDFGTGIDSDVTYVPLILRLRSARNDFQATFPWLAIRSSEPFTIARGEVVCRGAAGTTEVSGPGDIILEDDYVILQGGDRRPWISAGLRLKIPTASESECLGTGQADFGPQAAILQPIGERWFLLAEARYVVRGDPPGIDYRNTGWVSGGVQRRIGERSYVSLILEARQSAIRGREPMRDLTIGFDRRLSSGVSFRSAAFAGLSDTAGDFGLSAGLSFRSAPGV
jgi:hypothetical protein